MARKIDRDATSSMKALTLYSLLLFSGKRYSLTELKVRLGCSKATVLRLIEAIDLGKSLHVRVETEKIKGQSYYWATRPEVKPNVALDAKAIQELVMCRDMLWHVLPEALRSEVGATIERATVLLGNFDERDVALESLVATVPKGTVDYSGHQEIVHTLMDALRQHRIVELVYRAHDSAEGKVMAVAPIRLVHHRDSMYLLARREKDLDKTEDFFEPRLAVQRIESATITKRGFEPITSAAEHAGYFGFMPGNPFGVVVEAEARVAPYIRERIWSRDQVVEELDEGAIRLNFTATSENEVVSWVLGFAGQVRLLEPSALREQIGEAALAMGAAHAAATNSTTGAPVL